MGKIIGIDLGSTLSEVAIMEGGKPVIIINEDGERTTPSIVSLKNDERKVGSSAKRQMLINPKETINLIKRFIGGTYSEVKDNISHIQYDVKEGDTGFPVIIVDGKSYTPTEISAMILVKMKNIAEAYLGEKVTDAVITVPAYFNDAQRQATQKAGEIAGLNVRRIIAEPTAAILSSNIDKEKGGKYMVADYGGSTLDFSVADISDNVVEILASSGDVYCGGSDIDSILAKYICDEFKKDKGVDLSNDAMAMSRILESAEKAKIELSNQTSAEINIPYITAIDNIPQHLITTITRAKFNALIDNEVKKVINCAIDALNKSGLKKSDLNGILLVGGSTRIPLIQEELYKEFGVELIKSINPDEAVALGAAVQASILSGEKNDILLVDVTPLRLGIETVGGVMTTLIDENTTIPTSKSQIFSTAVDNQPAVTIRVLQGNRPMANDNKEIGVFHLEGIAPAMRGIPQIEVKFDIDANGILTVSATDKATGKEQSIKIEAKSGITDEEVERMKREAKEHEESDKKAKEEADKLNAADAMIFQTEKNLKDYADKITEEEKKDIEDICSHLRNAVVEKNIDNVDKYQSELLNKWNIVTEKIYKQNSETKQN